MLKIGEFSKLSRISVRNLRHYDEIGLLKPDSIDPYTDYRYYQEKQLVVAERIKTLREMDFSLSDITEMLKISECASKMEEYFLKRREELVREGNLVTHRLKLLDASLNRLRKDETMNVSLKTIPARHAATLTMTLPAYEDVSTLWRVMMEETAPLHIPDREKSLFAVTYLDGEYREKDILMEASFTVEGSYPDTAHVVFRDFPEMTVASVLYKGDYADITEAYAAAFSFVEEQKLNVVGNFFNIYHVSPADTDDAAEYVTEICIPVER